MIAIGLVGCGTIGTQLADAIHDRFRGIARLIGIYDHNPEAARRLSARFRPRLPVLSKPQLLSKSQLLIEAASSRAVSEFLPEAVRRRKPMLVMSTGGLLAQARVLREAAARGVPVYLPSGAIAGIDGIKAGAVGKLRSVTLTTRKPPAAFAGSPWVTRRKISLSKLTSPRVLFEGTAAQAVRAFPQNINVAATLSLAGLGAARTRVRIVADPAARHNTHEIEAEGQFGRLTVRTENRPAAGNPKTSRLAFLSAIATLRQALQPVRVGT